MQTFAKSFNIDRMIFTSTLREGYQFANIEEFEAQRG